MALRVRDRTIAFPRRPLLMGIVNVNDDSFCQDGTLDVDVALQQAVTLARDGADVIDVGAESARTNREAISVAEELNRLTPFLQQINAAMKPARPRDEHQVWPPLISVNTWRSEVVQGALSRGVDIINDMGGLTDSTNASLCAGNGTALLIMHTVGQPKEPHLEQQYDDVWDAMLRFFENRVAKAFDHGLAPDQLILDPGIDFAKQRDDNLRIYAGLPQLVSRFDSTVMVPVSRKTVIGDVLDLPDPMDRDAGSVACLVAGVRRGAQMFRVHDVRGMFEALKVVWAIECRRENSFSQREAL